MNVEQQAQQTTQHALLGQLYLETTKRALEADIARLNAERAAAGRFLQIDEELRELERVTALKASVLEATEAEASAMREAARSDVDAAMQDARDQAQRILDVARAQAAKEAAQLTREAEQAAGALRQSAEAVYAEARHKTATVDEELAGRREVCVKRERALEVAERTIREGTAALARTESLVDGKRSMLRAGIEALRRVLDEVQA